MHDPYNRAAFDLPRPNGTHVALSGPSIDMSKAKYLQPVRQSGGAVQLSPWGGQVAKLSMHQLPQGAAPAGRGVAAPAPGSAPQPTAPQIPMTVSPYSGAGSQSQGQQQYVSQNVNTPVNVQVVTQPQVSQAFTPNPVSQDLGPTVSTDVYAGMLAFSSRKCLLWLLAGGALAYFLKGHRS